MCRGLLGGDVVWLVVVDRHGVRWSSPRWYFGMSSELDTRERTGLFDGQNLRRVLHLSGLKYVILVHVATYFFFFGLG